MPSNAAGAGRASALAKRVASTLVLLPVFVGIVVAGPVWLFGVVVVLVAAIGQWEFTGMFERAGIPAYRWLGLAGGILVTAGFALPGPEHFVLTVVVLGVLAAGLWSSDGGRISWQPTAVTILGICYVNWLLGHSFWLRDQRDGSAWVLMLVWVTWMGETAAYLVGSALGRHKLAPLVSPGKTVEGAAAQLVVSVLAAVGGRVWFFPSLSVGEAVTVGVVLGLVGQVGDLAESALKRSLGTKDTGWLIPGHGGMLDRVDSLLFNTPILYLYVHILHGRAGAA
jgi:phosphatidate cytidylyltransferase